MNNCIFCKIVRGEVSADRIFEDDETLAFLDIGPTNKGHTLVIPKFHVPNIYEMSGEVLERTFKTTQRIAKAVKQGLDAEGINIVMNNDTAAGQVVFHAHIHVIPRFSDDGLKHWPHRYTYEEDEGQKLAQKIGSFV